jgi:hypothetical protein
MKYTLERIPRLIGLPVVGVTLLLTTGCSGGDVSCRDFRAMSQTDQMSAASDLLQQHGETDTPLTETAVRGSVATYCFLHSGDTPISGIYKP